MEALGVLHVLDDLTNLGGCLFKGVRLFQLDLLLFQRFETGLSFGSVVGSAFG